MLSRVCATVCPPADKQVHVRTTQMLAAAFVHDGQTLEAAQMPVSDVGGAMPVNAYCRAREVSLRWGHHTTPSGSIPDEAKPWRSEEIAVSSA